LLAQEVPTFCGYSASSLIQRLTSPTTQLWNGFFFYIFTNITRQLTDDHRLTSFTYIDSCSSLLEGVRFIAVFDRRRQASLIEDSYPSNSAQFKASRSIAEYQDYRPN